VVNMGELRRLACLGVPDGGAGVRPVVWKVPTRNLFPFSYAYVFCALSRLGSSPFLNCSAGLLCWHWSDLFANLVRLGSYSNINDGDCVRELEILYALLEELRVYDSKRNWASEVHKERKKAHCLKCGIFYSKIADMCQMSDCTGWLRTWKSSFLVSNFMVIEKGQGL